MNPLAIASNFAVSKSLTLNVIYKLIKNRVPTARERESSKLKLVKKLEYSNFSNQLEK